MKPDERDFLPDFSATSASRR